MWLLSGCLYQKVFSFTHVKSRGQWKIRKKKKGKKLFGVDIWREWDVTHDQFNKRIPEGKEKITLSLWTVSQRHKTARPFIFGGEI